MRLILSFLAAVILTGLLAYSAYLWAPGGKREIDYVESKPVYETKTFAAAYPVKSADGTIEKKFFTFDYSEGHLVQEHRVKTVESRANEKLRFWVLVGSCAFCAAYSVFVLGAWMKLSMSRTKGNRRLAGMEKRLSSIVTFGFGALAGILTVGNDGPSVEMQQALAIAESSQHQVLEYQKLLSFLQQDRAKLVDQIINRFGPPPVESAEPEPAPDGPASAPQPGPAPSAWPQTARYLVTPEK